MKPTNPKIIDSLQRLLADELGASHQYVCHAAICENKSYDKLADVIMSRAKAEMSHIDKLMERLTYYETIPDVLKLGEIKLSAQVPQQIDADMNSEATSIAHYKVAIINCIEAHDDGTRVILEGILREEEDHLNYLEAQKTQIAEMSLSGFLQNQV